ncbi:hypothetical protein SAMN05216525_102247 [Bradyrhizobium sp. Gha]|nr:hypothetical protein SAMN05216525_102247 [Bradyrhizobium sp. Gha]
MRRARFSYPPLQGRPEEGKRSGPASGARPYTAAVVTPPSITMVWPVMKLEASEAR